MRACSKRWCFTINNPGDYDPAAHNVEDEIVFAIWQHERGAQAGTEHIQGYVRFAMRKRMQTVKNYFACQDMHLESARGSEEECKNYCTKLETRAREGEYHGAHVDGSIKPENYDPNEGKQGHRTDLDAICAECTKGNALIAIAQAHPGDYIRYHAGIVALHSLVAPLPPLTRPIQVYVLWGVSGAGKTHRVLTSSEQSPYTVLGRGRDPWGRYRGEQTLLLDEFNWTQWTLQEMNALLDKWRCCLDCRYADRYAAWTLVYICCNETPNAWYPDASLPLITSLRRRLARSCREVLSRLPSLSDLIASEPNPNWGEAEYNYDDAPQQ